MNEPTVRAIMLTRDRPELAKRAVECFQKQTYEECKLMVFNTGTAALGISDWIDHRVRAVMELHSPNEAHRTIGDLRNIANSAAQTLRSDLVIHFDDDDWSHPNRITEQVALLQASGADCVGYNEMLFSREPGAKWSENGVPVGLCLPPATAWLYTNRRPGYALGTSLCYWRKTWEAKPFEDRPKLGAMEGEDTVWIRGLKVVTVGACGEVFYAENDPSVSKNFPGFKGITSTCEEVRKLTEPRMIARIHGGNTSGQYADIEKSDNWKRVPEWDARVREVLA